MLSESEIKQAYFQCKMKSPDGLYADDVDLYEFAHKIVEFSTPVIAARERARCVKFVTSLNALVGGKLLEWRGS